MKVWNFLQQRITEFGSVLLCVIDPDKIEPREASELAQELSVSGIDGILVGGTFLLREREHYLSIVKNIKDNACDLPLIIFPGASGMTMSIAPGADGILFLQLISGRNPQYLIAEQMASGLTVLRQGLEPIATGYVFVKSTATTKMEEATNTRAIEPRVPLNDALNMGLRLAAASQCLGHQMVYFECGSGASEPLPVQFAKSICSRVDIPVMTSGGIKTPEQIGALAEVGIKLFAVGTSIETSQNPRQTLLPLVAAAHWRKPNV